MTAAADRLDSRVDRCPTCACWRFDRHCQTCAVAGWHEFTEDVDDGSMCICGVPALSHDVVYPPKQEAPRCARKRKDFPS